MVHFKVTAINRHLLGWVGNSYHTAMQMTLCESGSFQNNFQHFPLIFATIAKCKFSISYDNVEI